jgi:hypothetical protein
LIGRGLTSVAAQEDPTKHPILQRLIEVDADFSPRFQSLGYLVRDAVLSELVSSCISLFFIFLGHPSRPAVFFSQTFTAFCVLAIKTEQGK